MTFQVLVKTAPHMMGSYSFMLEDEAAARVFVQRPDIWWYAFSDDATWDWKKGGAWTAAPGEQIEHDLADLRRMLPPVPMTDDAVAEDEDEDRW